MAVLNLDLTESIFKSEHTARHEPSLCAPAIRGLLHRDPHDESCG